MPSRSMRGDGRARQRAAARRSRRRASAARARPQALTEPARAIRAARAAILAANARDLAADARDGRSRARCATGCCSTRSASRRWREGLEEVAALPDPVGTELARWTRPNGLDIARVRIPLGVIGIIYESRPNVTADAGGLCLRAGNAAILRGGSESFHSSRAIAACLRARHSRRRACPRTRCSSCRRATAPRSA